jgi:hypothetical protein
MGVASKQNVDWLNEWRGKSAWFFVAVEEKVSGDGRVFDQAACNECTAIVVANLRVTSRRRYKKLPVQEI